MGGILMSKELRKMVVKLADTGSSISTSSWSLVFRVLSKNARFQMQSLNLDLETKTIFKGNFLLDCR